MKYMAYSGGFYGGVEPEGLVEYGPLDDAEQLNVVPVLSTPETRARWHQIKKYNGPSGVTVFNFNIAKI